MKKKTKKTKIILKTRKITLTHNQGWLVLRGLAEVTSPYGLEKLLREFPDADLEGVARDCLKILKQVGPKELFR